MPVSGKTHHVPRARIAESRSPTSRTNHYELYLRNDTKLSKIPRKKGRSGGCGGIENHEKVKENTEEESKIRPNKGTPRDLRKYSKCAVGCGVA